MLQPESIDLKANKKDIEAVIATNRFGMGARFTEIDDARHSPKDWLISLLTSITPPDKAPTSIEMIRLLTKFKQQQKTISEIKNTSEPIISQHVQLQLNSELIVKKSIESDSSINWRLLDFFSNHFSVSANTNEMRFLAPTLDWEAIAPNLVNSFSEMLIAVISHPAMLFYLNNEKSVGPNSIIGRKRKKAGFNENLAREIFELHTLGVKGDYSQKDIIELAKAITGWSIPRNSNEIENLDNNSFLYRSNTHEPGSRYILNKYYFGDASDNEQGIKILTDLANHPSTALHICTKLARHFVSDNPNTKLVKRMKTTWLKTKGDIKSVIITLIESDLAWKDDNQKFKSPREFLISTYRATNIKEKRLAYNLKQLGQLPYRADSPAGYGDIRSSWDAPNALLNRIEWTENLSNRLRKRDALDLAHISLSNRINKHTLEIIQQAESQQQAIALLFMSPDFMYR